MVMWFRWLLGLRPLTFTRVSSPSAASLSVYHTVFRLPGLSGCRAWVSVYHVQSTTAVNICEVAVGLVFNKAENSPTPPFPLEI